MRKDILEPNLAYLEYFHDLHESYPEAPEHNNQIQNFLLITMIILHFK